MHRPDHEQKLDYRRETVVDRLASKVHIGRHRGCCRVYNFTVSWVTRMVAVSTDESDILEPTAEDRDDAKLAVKKRKLQPINDSACVHTLLDCLCVLIISD